MADERTNPFAGFTPADAEPQSKVDLTGGFEEVGDPTGGFEEYKSRVVLPLKPSPAAPTVVATPAVAAAKPAAAPASNTLQKIMDSVAATAKQAGSGYMKRLGEHQASASQLSEEARRAGDPFTNALYQALAGIQGLYSPIGALFPREEVRAAAKPYGPEAEAVAVGLLDTAENVVAPYTGFTKIKGGKLVADTPAPRAGQPPPAKPMPTQQAIDEVLAQLRKTQADEVSSGPTALQDAEAIMRAAEMPPEAIAEALATGGRMQADKAYPTDAYHGTQKDFSDFRTAGSQDQYMLDRNLGIHFARDPEVSNSFVLKRINGREVGVHEGGNIRPVQLPPDSAFLTIKQPRFSWAEGRTDLAPWQAIESDQSVIELSLIHI